MADPPGEVGELKADLGIPTFLGTTVLYDLEPDMPNLWASASSSLTVLYDPGGAWGSRHFMLSRALRVQPPLTHILQVRKSAFGKGGGAMCPQRLPAGL